MIPLAVWLALAGAQELAHDRPGDVMPDRHWDVVHLDLDLKLDLDGRRVEGTSTHTLRPLGVRHRTLRLHQRALAVTGVRVDGEQAVYWNLGGDWLDITMPPDGTEHVVEVHYSAVPQTGLHFRTPGGSADPVREVWSQGEDEDNRHWFPSWDHPTDKFTVATHLTVPNGLVAVANGVQTGREAADPGWTRWSYGLDRPIVNYLVAIAVGDYRVVAEDGPVPLEYIGASTHSAAAIRRGFDKAKPQMVYMADLFDEPFPYPVYRQVMVSRFLYGGMENATLTVMADSLLQPVEGGRTLRTEEVTAHELAHQWFGDLVTCYGWRELWLNEGFATFYTGRWMEHSRGEEYYATKVRGWQKSAAHLSTPMSPRGWSVGDGPDNAGVYVRGATVLHMLRVALGDEVFDDGIRLYLDRHADRLVETDDLRRALEDVSGTHLGWFFDQWVHGVGIPSVETSWNWSEGELTVTVKQTTEGQAFWSPVDVEIGQGETVQTRRLWLGEGEARIVTELEAPPDWVAVDPRGGLLADWTRSQEPGSWIAQALESPSPHARIVALEQLGEAPAADGTVAALRSVLLDEGTDPAIRRVAAESLGALSTEEAVAALLDGALAARDSYLRESIVHALGETEDRAPTLARLERLTRDADADVAAAALWAVGALDDKRGLGLARQLLSRPDRSARRDVHREAMGVIGEHGGPADIAVLANFMSPKQPRRVRQSAGWAAASLWADLEEGRQKSATQRLEKALIPALDDPDLRVRQHATSMLAMVGDRAAEDALERFAAGNEVAGLSEQALDAASSIRKRRFADDDDPIDNTEDVERLNEEIDAIRDRLERLEEWK